ncbi:MAG: hypothetical protein ACYDEX_22025 [Mobilitalea sp.]
MKQTGRLTSFYTEICNENDAERVLSDLSIFWYAYSVILIAILLTITILTKEKVSFYFPVILLFAGYFLSRRKSRILSSFILFYSSALIGFVIWFIVESATANLTFGLSSSLLIILTLCLWSAYRSAKAAFVYHKKIGSQIFIRNIFYVGSFVLVLPLVVPLPYAFSEIPWQHINYADAYKYFTEEVSVYAVTTILAAIAFAILTHYFPLVHGPNKVDKTKQRLSSLFSPILSEDDAERVISDLSVVWYIFGIALIILSVIISVASKKMEVNYLFPIVFLLAGYLLPRIKSRVLSIAVLICSVFIMVVAIWVFLFANQLKFSLWLVTIHIGLVWLLIILMTVLGTWVAYRSIIATFTYHRHSL